MQFMGVLPEDAPDPRLAREEMLKDMPIPIVTFAAQPGIEATDVSMGTGTDASGRTMMSVSISATLWRNPHDKSDPVNLAEIDDRTRRAIEEVPPWPRPAWLVEQVERMRYPVLSEVVQTTWNREESDDTALGSLLVQHSHHVLMNQFREILGLGVHDWDSVALPTPRSVRHGVDVVLEGDVITGAEIDTDPLVYAIGAELPGGGAFTAVIPRDHLEYIDLRFAYRR